MTDVSMEVKGFKEILKKIKMWHRFHAVTFMEFCASRGHGNNDE